MRIVCPTCQKTLEDVPSDFPARPFCSIRCKQIDLGNWFDERYRISRPIEPEDLEEDPSLLERLHRDN
ncbi:MAG: DNA gyrase inhibitor YacG [Polyangiaceae bacterium]|nr:DNA gyrase inhibitor YacG [Polyangiaceae bacterium]